MSEHFLICELRWGLHISFYSCLNCVRMVKFVYLCVYYSRYIFGCMFYCEVFFGVYSMFDFNGIFWWNGATAECAVDGSTELSVFKVQLVLSFSTHSLVKTCSVYLFYLSFLCCALSVHATSILTLSSLFLFFFSLFFLGEELDTMMCSYKYIPKLLCCFLYHVHFRPKEDWISTFVLL